MSLLPKNTCLGNLKIIEIYEAYDEPCLFLCQNLCSQLFLSVLIDEVQESKIWLYVPVSSERFDYIRSGGIDLYNTYKSAEDDFVYKVTTSENNDKSSSVELITCDVLSDEILPLPGESLNLATKTLPLFPKEQLIQTANSIRREALRLKIDPPGYLRNEVPIKMFGGLLYSFQNVVETIGYEIAKDYLSGRRQEIAAQRTEFLATATSGGSYSIDLISNEPVNLLNTSLASDALLKLFEVLKESRSSSKNLKNLESENDSKNSILVEHVSHLGRNFVSRYKIFLRYIAETEGDLELNWGSPNPERGGSVRLTYLDAISSLRIISQVSIADAKILDVTGVLVGGNTQSKNFDIRDLEDREKKYVGEIADQIINSGQEIVLDEVYKAKIEESIKEDIATGQQKPVYKLVNLRKLGSKVIEQSKLLPRDQT